MSTDLAKNATAHGFAHCFRTMGHRASAAIDHVSADLHGGPSVSRSASIGTESGNLSLFDLDKTCQGAKVGDNRNFFAGHFNAVEHQGNLRRKLMPVLENLHHVSSHL